MELNVKELCNWGQSPFAHAKVNNNRKLITCKKGQSPISPDFFYVNHPKQILKVLFNRQLCFSLQ